LDEGADSSARNKMRFDAKLPHNNKAAPAMPVLLLFLQIA
jgi:hypothetical protein